jgi:putative addiction module component (TIGR02574 family)
MVGAYTFGVSANLLEEARRLTPEARLKLIGELWDTLSESDVPVTSDERRLLDARLADLEANPDDQSSWEDVKSRLEKRRG